MDIDPSQVSVMPSNGWAWSYGPYYKMGFPTAEEAREAAVSYMKEVSDAEYNSAVAPYETFGDLGDGQVYDESMPSEDFFHKLGDCSSIIRMGGPPVQIYILIAHIQLALRHPNANGASSAIARKIVENMAELLCAHVPEARESIELGWNPAYDIGQDYFEAEFN